MARATASALAGGPLHREHEVVIQAGVKRGWCWVPENGISAAAREGTAPDPSVDGALAAGRSLIEAQECQVWLLQNASAGRTGETQKNGRLRPRRPGSREVQAEPHRSLLNAAFGRGQPATGSFSEPAPPRPREPASRASASMGREGKPGSVISRYDDSSTTNVGRGETNTFTSGVIVERH